MTKYTSSDKIQLFLFGATFGCILMASWIIFALSIGDKEYIDVEKLGNSICAEKQSMFGSYELERYEIDEYGVPKFYCKQVTVFDKNSYAVYEG